MTLQKLSYMQPIRGNRRSIRKRSSSQVAAESGRVKKSRNDNVKTSHTYSMDDGGAGEQSPLKFEFCRSKCGKGFSREDQLYTHEVSHVVQGDFQKYENLRSSFKNEVFHSYIESEEDPQEGKTVKIKKERLCDREAMDDPYVCRKCNKTFTGKVFKKLHCEAEQISVSCSNLVVDPDHCFKCGKGDKTFYRKTHIKRHIV